MELQNLSPAPNSKPKSFRRGRGIGSGLGKTSGAGHKGCLLYTSDAADE